jgi:membrane associated rhomboid family serine protease
MNIINDLKQQYKFGGIAEKLIYWNIGLFAIPMIVFGVLSLFSVTIDFLNYVSLSSSIGDLLYQPWTLFTYFFFHAVIIHLLVNVLMLSFISRLFQTFFTQKQLLSVYLMGGLFAGVVYILSYYIFPALQDQVVSLVGASGAIMAILLAVTSYAPRMNVRLLLIGTVQLWQITKHRWTFSSFRRRIVWLYLWITIKKRDRYY